MARYLLESGSPDGYALEDGSGVLLIEDSNKLRATQAFTQALVTGDGGNVRTTQAFTNALVKLGIPNVRTTQAFTQALVQASLAAPSDVTVDVNATESGSDTSAGNVTITRFSGIEVDNGKIPAAQVSDALLGFLTRDGSNSLPGVPSGWTIVASATGSSFSACVVKKDPITGGTNAGNFTNTTSAVFVSYKNVQVGAVSQATGTTNTVTYPARAVTNGDCWVVLSGHHSNGTTTIETAPAGTTRRGGQSDATDELQVFDTAGPTGASGFPATDVTVSGTAAIWRTFAVELIPLAVGEVVTQAELAETGSDASAGDITIELPAGVTVDLAATESGSDTSAGDLTVETPETPETPPSTPVSGGGWLPGPAVHRGERLRRRRHRQAEEDLDRIVRQAYAQASGEPQEADSASAAVDASPAPETAPTATLEAPAFDWAGVASSLTQIRAALARREALEARVRLAIEQELERRRLELERLRQEDEDEDDWLLLAA